MFHPKNICSVFIPYHFAMFGSFINISSLQCLSRIGGAGVCRLIFSYLFLPKLTIIAFNKFIMMQKSILVITLCLINSLNSSNGSTETVKIFTVATEWNDGYDRYIRSAKYYGLEINTLGMGKEWLGGNMDSSGGGYKINLLKEAIKSHKYDEEVIILFTDSYDVVFTSNLDDILSRFKETGAKVLFGAEHFCWPDENLRSKYPPVAAHASRFLNSGLFIGYAPEVFQILDRQSIENTDDDQLFYTQAFLDGDFRTKIGIQLDTKSLIFQNLHGATNDVKLEIHPNTGEGKLSNVNFLTFPSVIHGNGLSKLHLNAFGNYLAGNFENLECTLCKEGRKILEDDKLPIVTLAVFVVHAMPYFEEFLQRLAAIDYPMKSIHLFIYSKVPFHDELINNFINKTGKEYKTVKVVTSLDDIEEIDGRNLAIRQAELRSSEYLFSIDADAHLDNSDVLKELISYNRTFIAPLLSRPDELWSNFWGAINEAGYYARSHDYVDIVNGKIRGLWNVPYASTCYLVKSSAFAKLKFEHEKFDTDMSLCVNLRNAGIFIYVVNMDYYGHLVNNEDYDITRTRPDFYTMFSNPADWQLRYIRPDYFDLLKPNFTFQQPCPDVYWLPIGTDQFCDDIIAIMENFGKWSDGSSNDNRLEGGYEAVPTRDIHMNQVGLEKLWLNFLQVYVRPLQEIVYTGYFHNPPNSLMNFVVRYKPDEQPSLKPHHDSSTYTINIALNRKGIDYVGGGCRFIRYNCSVVDTKKGWMLMHPGRLTHFHEGLLVTEGTRYIMISFVDP